MTDASLEIRTLDSAEEMADIVSVFQQVWGSVTPIVGVELLRAIAHAGGYVAGVFDAGNTVGASFGFLGRHRGEEALHSHVTGILPGVQHGGVGRAMKTHQREWAAERGIPWITWTFDPLVRRNAWFNITILGAQVADYLVNFYGPMSDAINSNDETDRIVIAWPTDPDAPGPTAPADARVTKVPTPEDIVVLRRTDPTAALDWRRRVRGELEPLIAAGGVVTDFTRAGEYVVSVQP